MMQRHDTPWWQRRPAPGLALLLAAVPFLWPAVPPLLDLPGHMASYHVALSLDRSPALQRFFAFHWLLIGNLGMDLLIMPVGRLLGVEAGTKLLVILIPVLTVAGLIACARAAHGRLPATLAFAFPLAYCYPLFFGFVNYCLAMAGALLGLAWWLRWPSGRRVAARALAFALLAAAVWLAHAIAWLLLGLACAAAELHDRTDGGRRWRARALVAAGLACLPLAAPVLLMPFGPPPVNHAVALWLSPFELGKWVLALLRDRWLVWDLASAVALVGVALLALAGWGGLRLNGRLGWPALAWGAAYVLLPRQVNGSDFFGTRAIPYAAALFLAAIRTDAAARRVQRGLALAAAAFFAARLAGNTASALAYDREWRDALGALERIPPGARIAAFVPYGCRASLSNWYNPRLIHLSGLATVRREAFTNSLWTLSGIQLLQVHYPAAGDYASDPSQFVQSPPCGLPKPPTLPETVARLPRGAFDYVWLLGIPPAEWPRAPGLVPVWRSDATVLFRVHPGEPA